MDRGGLAQRNYQADIWGAREFGEGELHLIEVINADCGQFHPERRPYGLDCP